MIGQHASGRILLAAVLAMAGAAKSSGFQVLLEGGGTLVIHKPAGLAAERRVSSRADSVIEIIRKSSQAPDAQLPHRLDKMTGGALVVALSKEALSWHNKCIQDKVWGPKIYVARLGGGAGEDRGAQGVSEAGGSKSGLRAVRREAFLPGCALPGANSRSSRYFHRCHHQPSDRAVPSDPGDDGRGRAPGVRCVIACMLHRSDVFRAGDEIYGDRTKVQPLLTHALLGLPLPEEQLVAYPSAMVFEGSDRVKKLLVKAAELSPPGVQGFSSDFLSFFSEYAEGVRRGSNR
eukprot:754506-Hanusia_phi.AAC.3